MATINPPWRLDPYQMIVNINWGEEAGDFVLIKFRVPTVSGDYFASSPTGSSVSYAVDPTNGTECPLTVSITELFPGAKIVYQHTDLVITPTTTYHTFLPTSATLQITTDPLGPCTGSIYDHDSALAYLEAGTPLPPPTTIKIGYHNAFTLTSGVGNPYTTEAAANVAAGFLNAGGTGSVGAAGGYSEPSVSSPGPYQCFDMAILWIPYGVTSGTFYRATFSATYVIQLPFSRESPPPHPEIPAFSIHTTGYAWSADISVFPKKGIIVDPASDPTKPVFPLVWEHGVPLGADGHPWAPFGTPDTDIQNAFLWSIFYEDQVGMAVPYDYPFAIVVDDHLTSDPPMNPNLRNSILQMYPTFVSTYTYFGTGSDWNVNGYADVPYGTSFKVPDAWGYSTQLTMPGPLPLIAVDTPY